MNYSVCKQPFPVDSHLFQKYLCSISCCIYYKALVGDDENKGDDHDGNYMKTQKDKEQNKEKSGAFGFYMLMPTT